jgi:hypothetical protein
MTERKLEKNESGMEEDYTGFTAREESRERQEQREQYEGLNIAE